MHGITQFNNNAYGMISMFNGRKKILDVFYVLFVLWKLNNKPVKTRRIPVKSLVFVAVCCEWVTE